MFCPRVSVLTKYAAQTSFCVNESLLTKTKSSFPCPPPSPRTDPNNKRMVSFLRATLTPLPLLSSPKVCNADTGNRLGRGQTLRDSLTSKSPRCVRACRALCEVPVDVTETDCSSGQGTGGQPPLVPFGQARNGPRGTLRWRDRLCLFRRGVLIVKQNPSQAAASGRSGGLADQPGQLRSPAVAHACRGG